MLQKEHVLCNIAKVGCSGLFVGAVKIVYIHSCAILPNIKTEMIKIATTMTNCFFQNDL